MDQQDTLSYENLRWLNDGKDVLQALDCWTGFARMNSMDTDQILAMVESPRLCYRRFRIPKKAGGFRLIVAPSNPLKGLQKSISELLGMVFEPDCHAMGFVPGKSIVDNAKLHVGKHYVLNLDLENFFPSIAMGRLIRSLEDEPFSLTHGTAEFLAKACCYQSLNGCRMLPQGAPSSPILSNIVCRKMDEQLTALANQFGLAYSRYADDITFSSDHFLFSPNGEFWRRMKNIIRNSGFSINEKKTRLQKRGVRQEVTGLTVGDKVNVDKRFVRRLRAVIHNWETFGTAYMMFHFREDPNSAADPSVHPISVIEGKLNYLRMVRGADDPCYRKLKARFDSLKNRPRNWIPDDFRRSLERKIIHLAPQRRYYFKTMETQKIYSLDTPLDFGKYKGYTIRNLVVGLPDVSILSNQLGDAAKLYLSQVREVKDHSYLCWLMKNADWFVMDKPAMAFCRAHEALDEEMESLNRHKQVYVSAHTVSIGEIVQKSAERIQNRDLRDYISTGIFALDEMTGGLKRGMLYVVAGRPAMGKTPFVLTIAKNMAVDRNVPVAYFSLETSADNIGDRLMMMLGAASHDELLHGKMPGTLRKMLLEEVGEKLINTPLFIDDSPRWSLEQLERKILQLAEVHHVQAVAIDNLQMLGEQVNSNNTSQGIQKALTMLKRLARKANVAIVLVSSLNRNVELRGGCKKPELIDLRSCGDIEQCADVVWMLYRPEYYEIIEDDYGSCLGIVYVCIAKNRLGPEGEIRLKFSKPYLTVVDTDEFVHDHCGAHSLTITFENDDVPF